MATFERRKERLKDIARERIGKLFSEASKAFGDDPLLSKRYVEIARRISSKHKVRIPRELRRRFCRRCNAYFVPSRSVRVRLKGQKMVYTCLECRGITRLPYLREKRLLRKARQNRKV